jgi:hypothetical protein
VEPPGPIEGCDRGQRDRCPRIRNDCYRLTSTVFGLLRYVPLEDGLLPLLRRARSVTIAEGAVSVCESRDWLRDGPLLPREPSFWPLHVRCCVVE